MTQQIITEKNPILRNRALPVKNLEDPLIKKIIKQMSDVLRFSENGIGIAASQIGYSLQIFLVSEEVLMPQNFLANLSEKELKAKRKKFHHFVFINPKILKTSSKKIDVFEGCLSVPDTYGKLKRAEKVKIEAYDENGKKFMRGTTGLFAQVIQHEIDHLNGVLFIDKSAEIINDKIKKQIK